jgi:hypothetical protein
MQIVERNRIHDDGGTFVLSLLCPWLRAWESTRRLLTLVFHAFFMRLNDHWYMNAKWRERGMLENDKDTRSRPRDGNQAGYDPPANFMAQVGGRFLLHTHALTASTPSSSQFPSPPVHAHGTATPDNS